MAYSIGKMRHKVKLQKPTSTRDAGGGVSQTYTTLKELWARIRPVSGSEKYRQGKVQESVTHEIIIRYRDDLGTDYRIHYESRNFNIKVARNIDERDRYWLLQCTEGEAI